MQKSRPDQPIVVYLAVFKEAVNTTLVHEVENEERSIVS